MPTFSTIINLVYLRSQRTAIKTAVALAVFMSIPSAASAQIAQPTLGQILTVAGGGSSSANNVPATSASINATYVRVDTAGNLYLPAGTTVRKIDASTGLIHTIVGTGTWGYSGDGGLATSAEIGYLNSMALDSSNNLFIPDTACSCIRKVDASTGIITTVAGNGTSGYSGDGGSALSASLYAPVAIAIDSAGNLYISDQNSLVIRKVTASTGIITTIAGDGTYGSGGDGGPATSAQLGAAYGIAVDPSGNIFLATYADNRIRRIDGATGIITTYAGTGTSGYSGDGGPATSAMLANAEDVAVNSAGDVFIPDPGNNRLRVVTAATGVITTIAGTGVGGFSGDGGSATSAKLYGPTSVAQASNGTLYIADHFNSRIRAVGYTPPPGATISSASVSAFADGDPVTIYGSGFGSSQGSSTVQVSGLSAAIATWSASAISFIVPSGATAGNLEVTVTVNGIVSTPLAGFKIKTTTTLNSLNPNPSNLGQTVQASATVSTTSPTYLAGTVTCTAGSLTSSQATASPGTGNAVVTLLLSGLPVGTTPVSCNFVGSGNFANSTSGSLNAQVVPAKLAPAVSLSSSANPSVYGDLIVFTVGVTGSGPTPTGSVTLMVNGIAQQTATLSGGAATFSTALLSVGNVPITISYSGDTSYDNGTSSTLTQVVTAGLGDCAP